MTAVRERYEVDVVREALTFDRIEQAYPHLEFRRSGSKYRLRDCPRCGAHSSSKAIWINPSKRTWSSDLKRSAFIRRPEPSPLMLLITFPCPMANISRPWCLVFSR